MTFAVSPAIPLTANNPSANANMGGRVGVRYPSPFFDLSQAYLPQNLHSLFRWCRYYALTFGPIYTYVNKMASYGLTRLIFGKPEEDHTEEVYRANRDRWKDLLENQLNIYPQTQRFGMHYFTYGNGYSSMHFPFRRFLVCPECKHHKAASDFPKKGYRWKNFRFVGQCQECRQSVKFLIFDLLVKTPKGLRIKLWNPEQVYAFANEATDDVDYYYRPSSNFSRRIRRGERRLIENTPWAFIRAVQKNTYVKFDPSNFFHIRCPSPDGDTRGYGYPPILAAIKDTFHLQLMKRAQEAGAIERAIPFPIVHPVPFRSESPTDPFGAVNLSKLMSQVEEQVNQARQDLNYIAMVPVPIGVTNLWGGSEGKALSMTPDIRAQTELIVADLGLPLEFYFGSLQWCLSPDSLAPTDGGLLSLEELKEEKSSIVATHRGSAEIALIHETGMKPAWRLQLQSGLDSISSPDHRYRTLLPDLSQKWSRLEDLSPGDYVAVKVGSNVWPKTAPLLEELRLRAEGEVQGLGRKPQVDCTLPESVTPELARLLGYLVSEGSIDERRASFANTDEGLLEDFLDCTEACFGYRPTLSPRSHDRFGDLPQWGAEIGRRRAVAFLRPLLTTAGSYDKEVPQIIRRSPQPIVADFLKALFSGDGSVHISETSQVVGYASASEALVRHVQLLLLNMGILAWRYPPNSDPCWRLQVRSEFLDRYAEKVGFVSPDKAAKLSSRRQGTPTHEAERIPYLKERLDDVRQKHFSGSSHWTWEPVEADLSQEEYTTQEVALLLDRSISSVCLYVKHGKLEPLRKTAPDGGRFGTWVFSKEEISRFMSKVGLGRRHTIPGRDAWGMTYHKLASADLASLRELEPELAVRVEDLAESRFCWLQVQEVEDLGYEIEMMDLTVRDHHSFIAEGMVTHNSGSNVSLRMLENQILGYRQGYRRFTNFVIKQASHYLSWEPIPTDWKPFKMADDIQQRQLMMTLSQMKKVGDHQLLETFDLDADEEYASVQTSTQREGEILKMQAKAQAEAEIEAQKLRERSMPMAPPGMVPPGAEGMPPEQGGMPAGQGGAPPEQGGMPTAGDENILSYAAEVANQLRGQPQEYVEQVLLELEQRMPPLAEAVRQMLMFNQGFSQQVAGPVPQQAGAPMPPMGGMQVGMQPGMNPSSQQGVMQPLPEQQAPRRGPATAAI